MFSSSATSPSRHPPPTRPSQSLEGMEKVVRPGPLPYAHTISRLQLDKPLPDIPSMSTPLMGSTAWSDDSSVASFEDDEDDDNTSQASYPVFVRSGSDDLADGDSDIADHGHVHPVSTLHDHEHEQPKPAPAFTSLLPEDRYRPPTSAQPHWAPRVGPNHYFREKKWDFFPELATPGVLPQNQPRINPARQKKDSGRSVSRWIPNPTERGAALANDVRNSIRYIQRRLSKNSLYRKTSKHSLTTALSLRPTTAPTPSEYSYDSPPQQSRTFTAPPNSDPYLAREAFESNPTSSLNYSSSPSPSPAPIFSSPLYFEKEALTHLSLSPTGSSISDQSIIARQSQALGSQKKKQLAIPMSPYQRYGAAIWNRSGKEKKRLSYRQATSPRVRFPRYRSRKSKSRTTSRRDSTARIPKTKTKPEAFVSSATLPVPLSPVVSPTESESTLASLSGSGSHSRSWSRSGIRRTTTRTTTRKPLQQGTRYAVQALQDGTSHVLVAIDGARKKIARSKSEMNITGKGLGLRGRSGSRSKAKVKAERKRTALKSQIRLVGPAGEVQIPGDGRDPWV